MYITKVFRVGWVGWFAAVEAEEGAVEVVSMAAAEAGVVVSLGAESVVVVVVVVPMVVVVSMVAKSVCVAAEVGGVAKVAERTQKRVVV